MTDECTDKSVIMTTVTTTNPTNNLKNKKRIITTTKKWSESIAESVNITDKTQFDIIINLKADADDATVANKIITQQIKQKISSYRYQDHLKGIYDATQNIKTVDQIVELLINCKMVCFYCNKTVSVIYENVCDPTQWTLERINNDIGHNTDNVCISCLKCNIGRRTMHQKRYLFTKKCTETLVELEDHY